MRKWWQNLHGIQNLYHLFSSVQHKRWFFLIYIIYWSLFSETFWQWCERRTIFGFHKEPFTQQFLKVFFFLSVNFHYEEPFVQWKGYRFFMELPNPIKNFYFQEWNKSGLGLSSSKIRGENTINWSGPYDSHVFLRHSIVTLRGTTQEIKSLYIKNLEICSGSWIILESSWEFEFDIFSESFDPVHETIWKICSQSYGLHW